MTTKAAYKKVYAKANKEIEALHKQADKLFEKSLEIAKEAGVPISFRVDCINGAAAFFPENIPTDLDAKTLSEITGFDSFYFGDPELGDDSVRETGWLSSYC